jgi:heme/copper-type cytochrome/quinol oxidase subunit 3
MKSEPEFAQNLSDLPGYGHGARSLMFWGVWGFILIEGTGFALAIAAYFFLLMQETQWPAGAPPPELAWGTTATVVMILSAIPNIWIQRAAAEERLQDVRIGIVVMCVIGGVLLGIRAMEFTALNVSWDRNAYGSITWALLVLHTVHLLTDWIDSLVLAALMFTDHGKLGRSFADCEENAIYWHFVVLTWLVIYAVVYWTPRLA